MTDQTWAQQTPAAQTMIRQAMGSPRSSPRKRRAKKATTKKRARANGAKRSAGGARKAMKAGSSAAKAWGKKMARLRKRK